jgi:hypothetical protein
MRTLNKRSGEPKTHSPPPLKGTPHPSVVRTTPPKLFLNRSSLSAQHDGLAEITLPYRATIELNDHAIGRIDRTLI